MKTASTEFSKVWKKSELFFQTLEKKIKDFPNLGKIGRIFSKPWKKREEIFQGLEKKEKYFPRFGKNEGAALILALWVLIILSLLISSFAFDMHIEAGITSYYRKRVKAQYLARAGVEYAKLLLKKSYGGNTLEETDPAQEDLRIKAINLSRGVGLSGVTQDLGQGKFTLDLLPEPGRRNVNKLTDVDWEEILDQGNVPAEKWPELIDCITDWIDEGKEEHQLNGAESDDEYYTSREYECKNAPMDTVDELLLIKGFTPAILYGGPSEVEGEPAYTGIAGLLTTWGDGKVNVNTASREVLLTLGTEDVPILDYIVDDIIAGRSGKDMLDGTKDDGWENVDEVIADTGLDASFADKITTTDRRFVRIVSVGSVGAVESIISCIFSVDESAIAPVFWREEDMK